MPTAYSRSRTPRSCRKRASAIVDTQARRFARKLRSRASMLLPVLKCGRSATPACRPTAACTRATLRRKRSSSRIRAGVTISRSVAEDSMLVIPDELASSLVTFDDVMNAVANAFRALDDGASALFDVVRGRGARSDDFFGIKSGVDGSSGCVGLKAGTYFPRA